MGEIRDNFQADEAAREMEMLTHIAAEARATGDEDAAQGADATFSELASDVAEFNQRGG